MQGGNARPGLAAVTKPDFLWHSRQLDALSDDVPLTGILLTGLLLRQRQIRPFQVLVYCGHSCRQS